MSCATPRICGDCGHKYWIGDIIIGDLWKTCPECGSKNTEQDPKWPYPSSGAEEEDG